MIDWLKAFCTEGQSLCVDLSILPKATMAFYLRLRWHLPKASMGFTLGKNYVGLI